MIDIMTTPKHSSTVTRTGTEDRLNLLFGSSKDAAYAARLDMHNDKSIENRSSIMFAYYNPKRLLEANGLL